MHAAFAVRRPCLAVRRPCLVVITLGGILMLVSIVADILNDDLGVDTFRAGLGLAMLAATRIVLHNVRVSEDRLEDARQRAYDEGYADGRAAERPIAPVKLIARPAAPPADTAERATY